MNVYIFQYQDYDDYEIYFIISENIDSAAECLINYLFSIWKGYEITFQVTASYLDIDCKSKVYPWHRKYNVHSKPFEINKVY